MSEHLLPLWREAFVTTVLIEMPIYALFLWKRLPILHALLVGFALQALTHPLFWLSWDALGAWPYDHYPLAVGLFETAIVLIEAAAIAIVLPPRQSNHRWPGFALGLVASLTANAISVIVGIILQ